jgi:hypothetical protein
MIERISSFGDEDVKSAPCLDEGRNEKAGHLIGRTSIVTSPWTS